MPERPAGRFLSFRRRDFVMHKRATESLAEFCIAQRNAFDPVDWYMRFGIDREAVPLAAKYLSMTSWYGHQEDLDRIASSMHCFVENSRGLYHQSKAIGFDLSIFSARVRAGVMQKRTERAMRRPDAEVGALAWGG